MITTKISTQDGIRSHQERVRCLRRMSSKVCTETYYKVLNNFREVKSFFFFIFHFSLDLSACEIPLNPLCHQQIQTVLAMYNPEPSRDRVAPSCQKLRMMVRQHIAQTMRTRNVSSLCAEGRIIPNITEVC